jgi:hypothetical protein
MTGRISAPDFNKLRPEELAMLKLRMGDLLKFLGAPGDWGYDTPMADLTIQLLQFSRQYLNIA